MYTLFNEKITIPSILVHNTSSKVRCRQIKCTLHLEAYNRVVWRANQFEALKGRIVFLYSR